MHPTGSTRTCPEDSASRNTDSTAGRLSSAGIVFGGEAEVARQIDEEQQNARRQKMDERVFEEAPHAQPFAGEYQIGEV